MSNTMPTQLEQAKTLIKTLLQTPIYDSKFLLNVKHLQNLTYAINHTPDGSIGHFTYQMIHLFYQDMLKAHNSSCFADDSILNSSIMRLPFEGTTQKDSTE